MIGMLLRAKHWHLFILAFGLPIIMYVSLVASLVVTILENPDTGPQPLINTFILFAAVMILSISVLEAWQWSVTTGCQSMLPEHLRIKLTGYKVFCFCQLVYIPGMLLGMVLLLTTVAQLTKPEEIAGVMIWLPLFIPFHLFAVFCQFYCLYITAKAIKTVELHREVTFTDFAGEFFLLWFFMIGVWILQPKLNKWIVNPPTVSQHIT